MTPTRDDQLALNPRNGQPHVTQASSGYEILGFYWLPTYPRLLSFSSTFGEIADSLSGD